ncbi:MAG: hypothetical protein JWN98_2202 [Abditibacteriota bacterium]|nr:hypothetical protein [Abditibacteriota bacterium]
MKHNSAIKTVFIAFPKPKLAVSAMVVGLFMAGRLPQVQTQVQAQAQAPATTAPSVRKPLVTGNAPFVLSEDKSHWMVRDGLSISLHPRAISGDGVGGPRGLIRIGLPWRRDAAAPRLLNFVAIEPVTQDGRRGYSELERSPADGLPGLRFWCDEVTQATSVTGESTLRLRIRTEKFVNGAHPYLIAELSSARPHEVRFGVYAEPDSMPMRMCILTATMGNLQRLRRLHLKGFTAPIGEVLPDDPGEGFTGHAGMPLSAFKRDALGAVIEADSDEADARLLAKEAPPGWAYDGENFIQYWRQSEPVDAGLHAVVNARKVYWASKALIPGGKSFENFELNAPFRPGQIFIYGVRRP